MSILSNLFKTMQPIKNALLNEDGSIVNFQGEQLKGADLKRAELYKTMQPIKNELLNEDGSTEKFPSGSGGGTGGTDNYNNLQNLPTFDGVLWKGELTKAGLDIASITALTELQNNTSVALNTLVEQIYGYIDTKFEELAEKRRLSNVRNGYRVELPNDIKITSADGWVDIPFIFTGEVNAANIYLPSDLITVIGNYMRLNDDISDKISEMIFHVKDLFEEFNWSATTEARILISDEGETFVFPIAEASMSANGGERNVQFNTPDFWILKLVLSTGEIFNRGGATIRIQAKTSNFDTIRAGTYAEVTAISKKVL